MNQSNTLFLHIGTPKTGTSAIQAFLEDNSDYLYRKGLYYPAKNSELEKIRKLNTGESDKSHHKKKEYSKYRLSNGNGALLPRLKAERVYGYYAVLCSKAISEHVDMLLSSESYWLSVEEKEEYFKRLKRLPLKIKVIVYFRRQDQYISSAINQWIKGTKRYDTLKYPECLAETDKHDCRLNYFEELEKIARAIGRENIIVRRYHKGLDIVSDFMKILDIPIDTEWVMPPKIVNPHLSRKCLKIMFVVNKLFKNVNVRGRISNLLLDLSVKFNKGTSDLFLWDEKVRQQILDEYEESNNKLARLYLNEERLFER